MIPSASLLPARLLRIGGWSPSITSNFGKRGPPMTSQIVALWLILTFMTIGIGWAIWEVWNEYRHAWGEWEIGFKGNEYRDFLREIGGKANDG